MQWLRPSSLDEYIEWYLRRERRKRNGPEIPSTPEDRSALMRRAHPNKLRGWFDQGTWNIVLIDQLVELERLVFFGFPGEWSQWYGLVFPGQAPNWQLLRQAAENALRYDYLGYLAVGSPRPRHYYEAFRNCQFRLEGNSRLALCSLSPSERKENPDGLYYIQDGSGRSLPYLMLIQEGKIPFEPVEAFLAEESGAKAAPN